MTYLDILYPQLERDEGKSSRMYRDSVGVESIGIGHNLRDKAISERAIRVIFEDDVADAEKDARRLLPEFDALSDARKAVVINMAFNLGYNRLADFHRTLSFIREGMYDDAARSMLDSKWAKQVGARALRLADAMRKG